MIPFLKRSKEASILAPTESIERKPDEGKEEYDHLEIAMEDLCNAIHSKDYKGAAEAFRAAFELLEMQPHEEIEHGE